MNMVYSLGISCLFECIKLIQACLMFMCPGVYKQVLGQNFGVWDVYKGLIPVDWKENRNLN